MKRKDELLILAFDYGRKHQASFGGYNEVVSLVDTRDYKYVGVMYIEPGDNYDHIYKLYENADIVKVNLVP